MKTTKTHLLSILIASLFTMIGLCCCSDDEPSDTTKRDKIDLKEIEKCGIWWTSDMHFVGRTGKIIPLDKAFYQCWIGAQLQIIMSLEGDKLMDISWDNAYLSEYHSSWVKFATKYRYDPKTGEIFLIHSNGHEEKYMELISYSPEDKRLVVHAHFGKYVTEGMLDDVFDPNLPGSDKIDAGSYAVIILKPLTDEETIEFINNTPIVNQ